MTRHAELKFKMDELHQKNFSPRAWIRHHQGVTYILHCTCNNQGQAMGEVFEPSQYRGPGAYPLKLFSEIQCQNLCSFVHYGDLKTYFNSRDIIRIVQGIITTVITSTFLVNSALTPQVAVQITGGWTQKYPMASRCVYMAEREIENIELSRRWFAHSSQIHHGCTYDLHNAITNWEHTDQIIYEL